MSNFVSLHNYTHFSILNSLISPKDLFARAKELNQPAVAITDLGSLAASWDALKLSKETGIKLIIGCEFYFVNDIANKQNSKLRTIVIIAKNYNGYKNLLALNDKGFKNHSTIMKRCFPTLDWKMLEEHSEGLICLTGCGNGIVGQLINNKKFDEAEQTLVALSNIFGENLGAEVQTHNLHRNATYYSDAVDQFFTNNHIIRLATKLNIRIVPTNYAMYLKREQSEVHDALLAIGSMQPVYSNARIKYDVSDLYLKSYDEVKAFFARNKGEEFAKQICANTLYFAEMCETPDWIDLKYSNPIGKELPVFPIENEKDYTAYKRWLLLQSDAVKKLDPDQSYLRFKCEIAMDAMGLSKNKKYIDRLNEELDVLYYCGVASYMLIVADYVNWAKQNLGTPSAGRGSVGGCLVAFLLGIHMADPIKYGLVFERFHNKLKQATSDIDVDISKECRSKLIDYIIKKYGEDKFAQITNYIYITPKPYVKDITRSFDFVNDRTASVKLGAEIADLIPKQDINGKEIRYYKDVIKSVPLFNAYIKKYPKLEQCADICGKPRSLGIHAAGCIISKRPVSSIAPTRIDRDNIISIQFDKDRTEEIGFVKMDILGLETLDIINQTNELIKSLGKEVPNINYEEYDKKTYDLISSGDTFGVFQFGTSAGTIDLCKRLYPKSIEDLAIITTLARPASKDIREDFIKVRSGRAKIKYMHPSLENALKDTYGFSIYDESLLILAKDVAGWDLAEADKLRKLTKEKGKNPEKAEKWRKEFIEGAIKNGIDAKNATDIWHNVVEPYSRYSFNKSHAIVYSMMSYHTAYLKAHFPVEFLLANLMAETRSNAKIAKKNIEKIKQELRNNKIKILSPDINKSDTTYKIQPDGSLLTGFEALKNVGDDAIKYILENRPFHSFDDFILRSDTAKIRSNNIQALVASGCLDTFGISRKLMYMYCADYKKKAQEWLKKHDPKTETFEYPWPIEPEWSLPELYALEKDCMGEAFICGKKEAYGKFFTGDNYSLLKTVKSMKNKDTVRIKVEIKDIFEFKIKKETSKLLGRTMAKINIEDETGEQITLTVFPDNLDELKSTIKDLSGKKSKLEEGVALFCVATVNNYEDEIGLIFNNLIEFASPPPLPKDIKIKKKVSKKIELSEEEVKKSTDTDQMIELLENELINEGLINLDEEDDF